MKKNTTSNLNSIPTSQKIFEESYGYLLKKLKNYEFTLFENKNFIIDLNAEYQKFRNSDAYQFFITENDTLLKRKYVNLYIIESIYDSVVVTKNTLEENESMGITQEVLIETTMNALDKEFVKLLNLNETQQELIYTVMVLMENGNDLKDSKLLEETFNPDNFIMKFIEFLKKFGRISIGILIFAILLLKNVLVHVSAASFAVIKVFLIDLFGLFNGIKGFNEKILTSKLADHSVKEYLNSNGLDIDKLIKKCFKNQLDRIAITKLPKTEIEIIDKINTLLFKTNINRLFNSSKNNSLFYTFSPILSLSKRKTLDEFGSQVNLCVLDKIKDLSTSIIYSIFDIGDVSNKLIKMVSGRIDYNRVSSTYRELFVSNKDHFNKAEVLFLESILVLINLRNLVLRILKNKAAMSYSAVNKYESFIKDIEYSFNEIEEIYKRSSSYSKGRNYEENYKQNQNKNLTGNKPTKPKKDNIFDI